MGLPWWLSGKESTCCCRKHEFDPWSGKIPNAAEQLSLYTATVELVLEPGSHNYWAHVLQPLKPRHPRAWNTLAPETREATREWPHSQRLEKDLCSNEDPALLLLLLSRFSRVRLCVTPQTAAHQAPLSLGFSRQEHWSGLPLPSQRPSTAVSK